ncbi:zonular occludens toxin domain-containing protein [Terasakiella pusilla]|uniref:zonular occludens toxin domain-containing protein n=1 Tax=Terasakiella pusilla TaxID=64973 RepID=UPI003AA7B3AF
MPINVYAGTPGSGKSYNAVAERIVPAVMQGRRVVTNIDGVDPDKVANFCEEQAGDGVEVGSVVLFDGKDATKDGFWPSEERQGFVKGGDLVVFDELARYFPKRGKLPTGEFEDFLRFHRHLVDENGVACDVVLVTQIAGDVHVDFRPLVERSFKFRKLSALNMGKSYAWSSFEGHLQNEETEIGKGTSRYRKEIFDLYSSYDGGADGKELKGDKRTNIFTRRLMFLIGFMVILCGVAVWHLLGFFGVLSDDPAPAETVQAQNSAVPSFISEAPSEWRISGHFVGPSGLRVILVNDDGRVSMTDAVGFRFEGERPVSGLYKGQRVFAEDRLQNYEAQEAENNRLTVSLGEGETIE